MENNKRKYNLGWALLKLWMCYEVVMVHAWSDSAYPGGVTPANVTTNVNADVRGMKHDCL